MVTAAASRERERKRVRRAAADMCASETIHKRLFLFIEGDAQSTKTKTAYDGIILCCAHGDRVITLGCAHTKGLEMRTAEAMFVY